MGLVAETPVSLFVRQWDYAPRPSAFLAGFILLTHGLALGCVAAVSWPLAWVPLILGTAVVVSGVYSVWRHVWGPATGLIQRVSWRETGGWELIQRQGAALPVLLQPYSFYSLTLSILCFKTRRALGSQFFVMILLPDNCSVALRRHLVMRMKIN